MYQRHRPAAGTRTPGDGSTHLRPEEQRISHVGDRVLFTIDAANTGTTVAAQQVQLAVKLEAGLHLERLSDDGKIQSDGSIVFTIDSIPPNSRITRKVECSCTAPVDRACASIDSIDSSKLQFHDEACVRIDPRRPRLAD